MKKLVIYWSRRDFRMHDNPALSAATEKSSRENLDFLPVFILEDYMCEAKAEFQFGLPSRIFLSQALPEFANNFENFVILRGKAAKTLINLSSQFDLEIFVNEDVYIDFYKQIEKIRKHNIKINIFADQLTISKETVSGAGKYYSIFTPFKKAVWSEFLLSKVTDKPKLNKINYLNIKELKDFEIIENNAESILKQFSKMREIIIGKHIIDLDKELGDNKIINFPYTNETQCLKMFKKYLETDLANYKEDRDSLEKDKTSKMSLALAWGLVSARILKQEVQHFFDEDFLEINWFKIDEKKVSPISYLSELIWREFYKYLLFHNPKLMQEEFQEKFRYNIDWVEDKEALKRFLAWIRGETGYKVVDAAMMQLRETGWMHNRSRMIVASVLTKNLGVDWRWGQEYFRAMLIDLDEASNNGGWQWGASVGADPKPIRIFNPYLQAKNYDPQEIYIKKWLGEKYDSELYFFDNPIVPHSEARQDALKRYKLSKKDGDPRDY